MRYEDVVESMAHAGRVRRYHTWPMLTTQTTGEHSHRVATLYVQLFGVPRVEVLLYCLYHDLGEIHAGDLPHHSKRRHPALKDASDFAEKTGLAMLGVDMPELTKEEWLRFKTCDLLELYEHCAMEVRMGNKYAQACCDTVRAAVLKMWELDEALRLVAIVDRGV